MKNDWWFKFEYSKWDDPSLQLCSMETQGFWLRIYIALRKSARAEITAPVDKLAGLAGCSVVEAVRSVAELRQYDVATVTLCNAQNVTCNSVVTLKSRSLERELSSKEKTRLRVARHRGNGDVTPSVTVQSKSKELEVRKEEEKEKEEEREKTPPEPKSILLFREFFPDQKLTPFHLDIIETRILDFERWRRALTDWKANSWSQKNVGNILNYYDELEGKQNGTNQKSSANHYRLADELERQGLAERAEAERRLLSGGDTHNHESDLVS